MPRGYKPTVVFQGYVRRSVLLDLQVSADLQMHGYMQAETNVCVSVTFSEPKPIEQFCAFVKWTSCREH